MTQAQAIQAGAADIAQRVSRLTPRQREALDLRAAGLLCREAAEQMGIGRWAYQDLCKQARKKLEVSSTAEAAALVSTGQAMRYKAALMLARDAMVRREPRHVVLLLLERALIG